MSSPKTSQEGPSTIANSILNTSIELKMERRTSADLILEAAKLAQAMGSTKPVQSGGRAEEGLSPLPATGANLNPSSTANPSQDEQQQRSQVLVQGRHASPHEVQQDGRFQNLSQHTSFSSAVSSPSHPLTPAGAAAAGQKMDIINAPDSPPELKHNVPHVYHDYGNVPDALGFVRKKTGGVTQPFPEKLYDMLCSETSPDGDPNCVVSWLPHGRAFIVRKPKMFTSKIMPKYFRQTKLTSFQRQLNLYGFRRITQGADAGAYYHELFLRGRSQLCMRMVRQKVKGTGHKQPTDVGSEPNFYTMPALQDLLQPPPSAQPVDPIVRPTCGFSTMAMAATSNLPTDTIGIRPPLSSGLAGIILSPGVHAAELLKGMANATMIHSLPPLPASLKSTGGSSLTPSLSQRDQGRAITGTGMPPLQGTFAAASEDEDDSNPHSETAV
jgi:hypothetical protein